MISGTLILVVLFALAFDYINGFHDSANAIATVVSTGVLTPRRAVVMAAVLNILGALLGLHVAQTIAGGLVSTGIVTQGMVLTCLLSAIAWNLITWYYGLPSSSSHALVGSLIGGALVAGGWGAVHTANVIHKVLIPMVTSPVLGFLGGWVLMTALARWTARLPEARTDSLFRKLQLASSAFMALSHGTNDAQKTMGIITMALMAAGILTTPTVPLWVILACALMMGLGTAAGGWRIVETMGKKICELEPIHGFAAETSAAIVILAASQFGGTVSTTHCIGGSIMGVGASKQRTHVQWPICQRIAAAWVLTIPVAATLSALASTALGSTLVGLR